MLHSSLRGPYCWAGAHTGGSRGLGTRPVLPAGGARWAGFSEGPAGREGQGEGQTCRGPGRGWAGLPSTDRLAPLLQVPVGGMCPSTSTLYPHPLRPQKGPFSVVQDLSAEKGPPLGGQAAPHPSRAPPPPMSWDPALPAPTLRRGSHPPGGTSSSGEGSPSTKLFAIRSSQESVRLSGAGLGRGTGWTVSTPE